MATNPMSEFVQHLRNVMLRRDGASLTDGQLLEDYVSRRDKEALTALVRRHGPMVWGVCRRLLFNFHDAEDAFQATFLVLVRKASSIVPREMVANWLYGVARQTALKARATAARRKGRERQVATMPEPAVGEQDLWLDLQPLLDEELSRLPDKYRVLIVLCDLEGKTRKEVAQQLGCPEGTVAGRLARARTILAKRIAQRGVALSGASLTAMLTEKVAFAGAPTSLVPFTIKAVTLAAAGQAAATGVISVEVAALTEGVLTVMLMNKLKVCSVLLVVAFVLSAVIASKTVSVLTATELPPAKLDKPPLSPATNSKVKPKPITVGDDAIVQHLVYSPDGKTVATISDTYRPIEVEDDDGVKKVLTIDSTLKLWDAKTGKLKRTPVEEKNAHITDMAFSSDGKTVAIAVFKAKQECGKMVPTTEIRLMDPEKWELRLKLEEELKLEPGDSLATLTLSPDGKRLVLGGYSQLVEDGSYLQIWDVPGKRLIGGTKKQEAQIEIKPTPEKFEEKPGCITCLAFSPDGKLVAAGNRDSKIRLFDPNTGDLQQTLEGHSETVWGIAFTPDGKVLASGSSDRAVNLWNVRTGNLRRKLEGNKGLVNAVAFSSDGILLATSGGVVAEDKVKAIEVILWNIQTGELKQVFPDQKVPIHSVSFSPDGKTLAIGGGEGGDLKDGRATKTTGEIKLLPINP